MCYNADLVPTLPVQPNKYATKRFMPIPSSINIPDVVNLQSCDPSVPLPDPDYLSTHCRIAEILEASGLGWKIEQSLDMAGGQCGVVDPNGSTDLGSIISRRLLLDI